MLQIEYLLPVIVLVALHLFKSFFIVNKKHKRKQKTAKKILSKIRTFEHDGKIITYLRKIDPFVFEELILEVLNEQANIRIKRNKRYTGDGGIDGQFWLMCDDGTIKHILIQAKRYKSYINQKDVLKFKNLVRSQAHIGLFVHTGKTGKQLIKNSHNEKQIYILSGSALVDFLKKRSFVLFCE